MDVISYSSWISRGNSRSAVLTCSSSRFRNSWMRQKRLAPLRDADFFPIAGPCAEIISRNNGGDTPPPPSPPILPHPRRHTLPYPGGPVLPTPRRDPSQGPDSRP